MYAGLGVTILCLSATFRAPAQTFDPASSACLFGSDEKLGEMIATLTYADGALPKVEKDTEKSFVAMDAETTRARKANYERYLDLLKREAGLEDRPDFRLWKLRQALRDALAALRRIEHGKASFYSEQIEAARLQLAISAVAPFAAYGRAINAELFIGKRSFQIRSDALAKVIEGSSISADLGYYMECRLAKVMGRQKTTGASPTGSQK